VPKRDAWIGVLASVVSAVLFALAFPPTSFRPLAWVALAPFFVALRRGGIARALGLTWLWCLVAAYGIGDWFPTSVAEYFHQPFALAALLFFAVFTIMAGPYYAAEALAYRVLARRFTAVLPLLAGAAWVMAELGRGRLFTGTAFFIGNPWGLLGYSHADVLPLVQVASITGIYGVSFALAAVNAALAELWISLRAPERRRGAFVGLVLAGLVPALFGLYGRHVLANAKDGPDAEAVTIAIAQGNNAIGSRWRSDAYGENLDVYLRLTEAAIEREPRVSIAFWPEAALTFFLPDEDLLRAAIARLLRVRNLELVTGGPRAFGPDRDRYTNSVFVVEPDGELSARYDKQYLVPFAEYFPLHVDLLRRTFGRIRTFEPGRETAPITTRAGPAGVLVCNESMLPEVARQRVREGALLLVNPSNDTWISDEKYSEQQLDIAQLRSIEERRWLVRASTSGPSALIDPFGRVRARTPGLERAVAVGDLWPQRELTVYARVGDAFGFACVAAVGAAVLWVRRRERASDGDAP
jgi:apolipoprotein N-acyltransferase